MTLHTAPLRRKADLFPPLAPPEVQRRAKHRPRLPSGWWIIPFAIHGLAFWAAVLAKAVGWW